MVDAVELGRRDSFGVGEHEKEVIGEENAVVHVEGYWEGDGRGREGGVK